MLHPITRTTGFNRTLFSVSVQKKRSGVVEPYWKRKEVNSLAQMIMLLIERPMSKNWQEFILN